MAICTLRNHLGRPVLFDSREVEFVEETHIEPSVNGLVPAKPVTAVGLKSGSTIYTESRFDRVADMLENGAGRPNNWVEPLEPKN